VGVKGKVCLKNTMLSKSNHNQSPSLYGTIDYSITDRFQMASTHCNIYINWHKGQKQI